MCNKVNFSSLTRLWIWINYLINPRFIHSGNQNWLFFCQGIQPLAFQLLSPLYFLFTNISNEKLWFKMFFLRTLFSSSFYFSWFSLDICFFFQSFLAASTFPQSKDLHCSRNYVKQNYLLKRYRNLVHIIFIYNFLKTFQKFYLFLQVFLKGQRNDKQILFQYATW